MSAVATYKNKDTPHLNTAFLNRIHAEVAERLAHERKRGEKSKYAPYIDVLPTLEDDSLLALPRFWKGKRLDLVTDGGQLDARMRKDDIQDIGQFKCVDVPVCGKVHCVHLLIFTIVMG